MARTKARLSAVQLRSNKREDVQQALDTLSNQIELEFGKIRKRIKAIETTLENL